MPFCIYSLGFYLFPLFLLHFLVLFKKKKVAEFNLLLGIPFIMLFSCTVYYFVFAYSVLFAEKGCF